MINALAKYKSVENLFYVQENTADELYDVVLREFLSILVSENETIIAPIEGSRSKTGFLGKLNPKVFTHFVHNFINGKSKDAHIIPVTINYDRILEEDFLSYNSEAKMMPDNSLSRFISTARLIDGSYGEIWVNFWQPISLQEKFYKLKTPETKLEMIDENSKTFAINSIVSDVTQSLIKNTVIMSSAPLASSLLQHKNGIKNRDLVRKIRFINGELRARNILTSEDSISIVESSRLQILADLVCLKNGFIKPLLSSKWENENILKLSYYRNSLISVFSKEAIIGKQMFQHIFNNFLATSLFGFYQKSNLSMEINKDELWEKVSYLTQILNCILIHDWMKINSYSEFDLTLRDMSKRRIINLKNDLIKIETSKRMQDGLEFFWNLVWPLIDALFLSLRFIQTLDTEDQIEISKVDQNIHKFIQAHRAENKDHHCEITSQEIMNCIFDYLLDKRYINFVDNYPNTDRRENARLYISNHNNEDLIKEEIKNLSFFMRSSPKYFTLAKYTHKSLGPKAIMLSKI